MSAKKGEAYMSTDEGENMPGDVYVHKHGVHIV